MTTIEFEATLTAEEREIRDTVHKFAEEVMRPVGERLDKLPDPAQVIAADSPLWSVFEKARGLGLDEVQSPTSGLAPEQQARLRSIISEEMGWGDSGLAISLGVSGFPKMMAQLSGNPELIERFGGDDVIGCWPITEPDHGSDHIMFAGRPQEFPTRPNCVAVKDGDSYVIEGQKAAWVSNGSIATAAALFSAVEDGGTITGSGVFLVPLDEPGVSRGKPLDKVGQRALNQGEVFFDHLRIPASYMVVPPEIGEFATDTVLCTANGGMGATFVGVARAALEAAVDYAKEREQGGGPIIRHQSVKARLFEMYRKTQAARALSRHTLLYNAVNMPPSVQFAVASKVTATQTAFEVASGAIQIFGGNGLSREYPVEKLMRDARASMIEDGCNEVLSLVAADRF